MNDRSIQIMAILGILQLVLLTAPSVAQTTAFSYQGQLNKAGTPANGNFEMEFKLFDTVTDGNQIGDVVTIGSLPVINGHFTASLDFGSYSFDDVNPRFLEISVRPAGSQDPFVILLPRQPVRSTPFAIQARKAAVADVANNALQLGGIDASEYVTTTSAGNAFIRNGTTMQDNAGFHVVGDGIIRGRAGVGIVPNPGYQFEVQGRTRFLLSQGFIDFGSPNTENGISLSDFGNSRSDIRFNGSRLGLFAGTGTGVPIGGLSIDTAGTVSTTANLGVGTPSPLTRLSINGGPLWTNAQWKASMNLENGAAIGWTPNASGQRYGIGQSSGGLFFFRTNSDFGSIGTSANYSLAITDSGNVVQARENSGLVKAMIYVNSDGTIARCYNGITHQNTGTCGFTTQRNIGSWWIDLGFQIDNRFWSVTPGIGVSNIAAQAHSVGPNILAVKLYLTDVPNNTGENVFRNFMLIVY